MIPSMEAPMSWLASNDPVLGDARSCDALEMVSIPRVRDLGGLPVRRALPHDRRQMVGPFIFFDHFGPVQFFAGQGMDVRPHPHIGLATVTYLFDGCILHRDSEGNVREITPGAMNLMTAGRGIAHSERTPEALRGNPHTMLGLQSWIALPTAHEEVAPSFQHFGAEALPVVEDGGMSARIVAGSAFGKSAPVGMLSEWFYVEVALESGAAAPLDPDYEERAIYVVEGEIEISGDLFEGPRLLVFRAGDRITLTARRPSRVMFLGGAAMEDPVTSGGTSCPRARSGSNKPKRTGRPAVSIRFPGRRSSSRCRSEGRRRSGPLRSNRWSLYPMLLQPRRCLFPRRFGVGFHVARTIVRVKGVAGVVVDDDLRAAGIGEFFLHRHDLVMGNALVDAAVEAEHGDLQLGDDVGRILRPKFARLASERPVPRNARLQAGIMCRIEPRLPPAPAKSGHGGAVQVGRPARLGEGDRRVEIAQNLRVGFLGHDVGHQLLHVLFRRRVALSCEQFGRDRVIAELGPAPTDILDVLVHAENLVDHQHGRKLSAAVRHRAIGGDVDVAGRKFDLAGDQTFGGRRDRLAEDRRDRRAEADAQAPLDPHAAIDSRRGEGV